ncbi:hypothetical protein [Streptomyces sp. NBC_00670]|jgi:hypothetical protein|uniref:hypothetical protein n=1 Tax=Streptomyces sp. NBC_00670 TaxID=2975804 RepID=UPI002E2FC49D|nr:hypothetical protein [Streptomyces sp. NBC_00670]
MKQRNGEPVPDPQNDEGGGMEWEDEFGFSERQFVVEDPLDGSELPLPPAVTSAPPAPAAEPPEDPSAQ